MSSRDGRKSRDLPPERAASDEPLLVPAPFRPEMSLAKGGYSSVFFAAFLVAVFFAAGFFAAGFLAAALARAGFLPPPFASFSAISASASSIVTLAGSLPLGKVALILP